MRKFALEDFFNENTSEKIIEVEDIVKFLIDNPRPTDDQMHSWAESNGYNPKSVEEEIYKILAGMIRRMSRSLNVPDSNFIPDELKSGIKVEKEHTDSEAISKMIAKDHLTECATYYSRLDELEKNCKKEASTEGHVDGKRHRELEYTFYAKMANISQLSSAIHKEEHEQWSIPVESENEVRLRIRCINGMRYVLTTKFKYEGKLGWEETECDISKDMFDDLKMIAKGGMKKVRYHFKAEGTDKIWEVDVFKDSNGQDNPWIKIDFEINDPSDKIPMLPFDVVKDSLISKQSNKQSDEEKARIKKLWSEEWVSLDSDQRLVK